MKISDNVLSGELTTCKTSKKKIKNTFFFKDIASKDISIDEAIEKKMFRAYGDKEVWTFQFDALRKILNSPQWTILSRHKHEIEEVANVDDDNNESIDYGDLPQMDLSNIPTEFKQITEQFISLRKKYIAKKL